MPTSTSHHEWSRFEMSCRTVSNYWLAISQIEQRGSDGICQYQFGRNSRQRQIWTKYGGLALYGQLISESIVCCGTSHAWLSKFHMVDSADHKGDDRRWSRISQYKYRRCFAFKPSAATSVLVSTSRKPRDGSLFSSMVAVSCRFSTARNRSSQSQKHSYHQWWVLVKIIHLACK